MASPRTTNSAERRTVDFKQFDQRHYPTLGVQEGYAEWSRTYESVVQDAMDLRIMARLSSIDWARSDRALELACGTGRIGTWLRGQEVRRLDGVDFTPEMLAQAQAKNVYDRLVQADIQQTGLAAGTYDLLVMVLADEHLPDLAPVYREAARLASRRAMFVVVGYHPYFLMHGIPTHFDRAPGQSVAIESHVHLTSDHVKAAAAAGWLLAEMEEGVVDEEWIARKPKWAKYRSQPVSFALVWARQAA